MESTFKNAEGKRLAQLLARSLAFEWCGSDQDADKLRQAVARFLYDHLLRVDVATDGKSSQVFAEIIKNLAPAGGQADPILQVETSPDECGAQRLTQVLCGMLPPQLRSLQALLKSLTATEPRRKGPSASSAGKPNVPDNLKKLASQIQALALPLTNVSSRWPTVKKLGEELQRRYNQLKGLKCASTIMDIDAWLRTVPLQAAKSEVVGLALQTAFKGLGQQGAVNSNAQLGKKVHDSLAEAIARDLTATRRDVILVAENNAYLGPNSKAYKLDYVEGVLEQIDRDYSLSVLAQARGSKLPFMIRARGSEVSREDLVLFKGVQSVVPVGTLGLEGRPEVYEIKPLTRLTEGVSQVTAYSWNYMIGNAY
jgi:hypothetical protein